MVEGTISVSLIDHGHESWVLLETSKRHFTH